MEERQIHVAIGETDIAQGESGILPDGFFEVGLGGLEILWR